MEQNVGEQDKDDHQKQTKKFNAADFKKKIEKLQAHDSDRLSYESKKIEEKSGKKPSNVWLRYKQVYLDGEQTCIWKCNHCPSLFTYSASSGSSHMSRHMCNGKNTSTLEKQSNTSDASKGQTPKIKGFFKKDVPQESIRQLNRDITIGLARTYKHYTVLKPKVFDTLHKN